MSTIIAMVSRPDLNELGSDFAGFLEALQTARFKVDVSLTPSDELQALRARVASLEAALETEKANRIRAENLFADESYLNHQLLDLCRDAGVAVPGHFYKRYKR